MEITHILRLEEHSLAILKEIRDRQDTLYQEFMLKMSQLQAALDKLTQDVDDQKSLIDSAIAAINGFPATASAAVAEALKNAGVDDAAAAAAVAQVDAKIGAQADALKTALTANTPEAPTSAPATPAADSPAPAAEAPAAEAPAAADAPTA